MLRAVLSVFLLMLAACTAAPPPATVAAAPLERPNIVLVVFEDMSGRIGALGDPVARTPVLDAFAAEAVVLPNGFTTAGVCAPSRSALITGVHQQTLGTQHMRTKGLQGLAGGGPVEYEAVPPPEVKAFPELLREAGYYTSNNGKTDYQFGEPFTVWNLNAPDADWRGRAEGQPFFAMVNIYETHESYIWPEDRESENPVLNAVTQRNRRDLSGKERVTDPADVIVPPWLPDTPVVRADLARHYDNIAFAEHHLAEVIAKLREDGVLDETIIIVTTDHGDGLPGAKRTVYDAGIRVPIFVRFPDGRMAGTRDDRLISFVDLAPTILRWAGLAAPDWIQGRDLFIAPERRYIYAASDRIDTVMGRRKAVRDARYKYIRNYDIDRNVLFPLPFRDALPTMQEIWRLHRAGTLNPMIEGRITLPAPAEELYDLSADPQEVANIAGEAAYRDVLMRMRAELDRWTAASPDLSATPEAAMIEAMWPGGVQPATAPPRLTRDGNRLILSSPTEGSSIAYGRSLDTLDRVATGSVAVRAGDARFARAVRYGYSPSAIVELAPPS